ncbi:MAG TPA: hypothetical protein VNO30_15190 [Kofleriaceae bacterium]|nr:hypothetical protein [Kofleriaceae bacterium]
MPAPHPLAAPRPAMLDVADLARVTGGEAAAGSGAAAAQPADFGRCGPGSSWKWLGNVYTPACAAHDAAVRGRLASGSSAFMAHAKSLPLLPAAIGSYVRERLR